MDNMHDYVKWLGRFSFDELPFTDVDALVFCQLAYYDMALFEDYGDLPLSLSDLNHRITVERHIKVNLSMSGSAEYARFFENVARSKRFGGLIVQNYKEKNDRDRSVQFAAVSFLKKDDFNFIAYRGTDHSLAGWKEDFMLSFMPVEAQRLALEFAVENIVPGIKNYLGGHSKGGNLALYAACSMDKKLFDEVHRLYLLDSPGLCKDVMDLSPMERVSRKAVRIIPAYSVIGKLFEPKIPVTIIVDSSQSGVMQHDFYTWGVDHGALKRVKENDPHSENISLLLKEWLDDVSTEEREEFVNDLFNALSKDGAQTFMDVKDDGVDLFETALAELLGKGSTRRTVASISSKALFGDLFTKIKKMGFIKWFDQCTVAKCILVILAGIFLIFASKHVLQIGAKGFFTALAAAELVVAAIRLYQAKWDFNKIKYRTYFLIILIVVCVVIYVRSQALVIMGSLLYGAVAFIIAFTTAEKITEKAEDLYMKLLYLFETLFAVFCGVAFLVVSPDKIYAFALTIGIVLILDGIARLVHRFVPYFNQPKPKKIRKRR